MFDVVPDTVGVCVSEAVFVPVPDTVPEPVCVMEGDPVTEAV